MTTQQKKNSSARHGFKTGESIVYPAHGVGTITAIEEQEVAGMKLELFVIDFEKDKMRLKVPVAKAVSIGMRKLSSDTNNGRWTSWACGSSFWGCKTEL